MSGAERAAIRFSSSPGARPEIPAFDPPDRRFTTGIDA
jgi:hypothetical protein